MTNKQLPTMITTTQRQPCLKAFTIIESLVVLVILTVLSMVVMALFIHEKKTPHATGKTSTAPQSAPADPLPTKAPEDKTE